MPEPASPIRLAVVNDYEVVVRGIAAMLAPFGDRVQIVEMDSDAGVIREVDIALYDTFSTPALEDDSVDDVIRNPRVRRTVLYTWVLTPELVADARRRGIEAALPKGIEAGALVRALERIHAGEVLLDLIEDEDDTPAEGVSWPGQREGLTARESEVVALITDGLSNQEIATRAYLSINSVKSYIRSAYRTMGVTSRSQAVLWGIDHGFARNRVRIAHPNGEAS